MNPRTFLKQFAADTDRERLVTLVYDEMVGYCQKEGITVDDISHDEMEQLAEAFVTRGFTFENEQKGRYRSQDVEDFFNE